MHTIKMLILHYKLSTVKLNFFDSFMSDFCLKSAVETQVVLDVNLSENDIQRMLYHISQLDNIR